MDIRVETKLTVKELFDFMIRHFYSTIGGICGVLLSVGALVMFFSNVTNTDMTVAYKVALVFIALLFTVIQPIMLYFKAAGQIKNSEAINGDLVYEFNNSGISISQGENNVSHTYEDVTKVISTRSSIILYINKYRAFIIPKRSIDVQFEDFKNLIVANVDARTVKVK